MNLDSSSILNALPDAVLVRDGDGVVRFVNAAAERVLGVRAADLVGGRELPWLSTEDLASQSKITVNAGELWLEVEVVPLDGAEAGSLVVYRDVTQRRQIEEYDTYLHFDMQVPIITIRNCIDVVIQDSTGEINPKQSEILLLAARNAELTQNILINLQ